jgi:hypothetical protein
MIILWALAFIVTFLFGVICGILMCKTIIDQEEREGKYEETI